MSRLTDPGFIWCPDKTRVQSLSNRTPAMSTTLNGQVCVHVPEPIKPETGEKMSEEKVEMSEVPLMAGEVEKSGDMAPDAEKEADSTEKATAEKTKAGGGKFRQFFRARDKSADKKKEDKKTTEEEAKPAEEKEPEAKEPKVKTNKGWFCKHKKPQENGGNAPDKPDTCPLTMGLNLLDRDEKNVNDTVRLSFEDVFAEPDATHSVDCAWRLTARVFLGVRWFLYRLLALLFAVPCAIFWGIIFSLLAVLQIWACTPFGRALAIPALWVAKVWNFVVRSVLDPFWRSASLCFGNISYRRLEPQSDPHMA